MKRKIFIAILIFFSLCLGVSVYLNKVFIPLKVKSKLIDFLQEKTKRKVSIQGINYNLLKGIVLKEITISEENNQGQFLKIKEINLNPQILPIFINKKIIIPVVNIISAEVNLIYTLQNDWNFSSLIPQDKEQAPNSKKQPFSFIVLKINIADSKIHLVDQTKTPEFISNIENINIGASILPNSLGLNAALNVKEKEFNTLVYLKSKYNFKNKDIASTLLIKDIDVVKYNPYLSKLNFNFEKCYLDNIKVISSWSKTNNILSAKIESQVNKLAIRINKSLIKLDNTHLNGQIDQIANQIKYSGKASLNNASWENINIVKNITAINGDLYFSNDKFLSDGLTATTSNITFNAKGSLSNFKDPCLDLKLDSNFDLKELKPILPKNISEKFESLNGGVHLTANILGPLDSAISNITGDIKIDQGNLKFRNFNLPFANFSANIKFGKDKITVNLDSKELKFDTEFDINQKIIQFVKLKTSIYNSTINLESGSWDFTDSERPNYKIALNCDLDINDLRQFFPKIKTTIEGKLNGPILIEKGASDEVNIISSMESELIKISGLNLTNFNLVYNQEGDSLKNSGFTASSYEGDIKLVCNAKILENSTDFISNLLIENIRLGELKKDTKWKDKNLAGTAYGQVIAGGNLKDSSTIEGQGIITITDGYLWELQLFKGLSQVLSIVNFDKIIFNEGGANFIIKNNNIYTNNLTLTSPQLKLTSQGSLGLDGKLDFIITSELQNIGIPVINDDYTVGKIFGAIMTVATGAIQIKLTGTIKEPKFKTQANPTEIIKQIPGIFR